MDRIKDYEFEKSLADTERLLMSAARDAGGETEYTLESILEEFGGYRRESGGEKNAQDGAASEEAAEAAPPAVPEVSFSEAQASETEETAEAAAEPQEPPASQTVRLQDVMESTVDEVLREEGTTAPRPKKRRNLLRRRFTLWKRRRRSPAAAERGGETETVPFERPHDFLSEDGSAEEEPCMAQVVADCRNGLRGGQSAVRICLLLTLMMWIPLALDLFGLLPEPYRQERLLSCLPYMVLETLVCLFGRSVFIRAVRQLRRGRASCELLSALTALVTLADSTLTFFSPERTAPPPFHAIGALGIVSALWGQSLLTRARYDTFRVAAVGKPNYIVTCTAEGAAKRQGASDGFILCANKDDPASHWQVFLLPNIMAATLVFAVISTFVYRNGAAFMWNWSVLLCSANMFAFPLCYSLPFRRLTRRFVRSGSALAGYRGALRLRKTGRIILTDTDLFPPGTVSLSGLKIFGEESRKVFSYAATMAHASESGLARQFEALLQSEGASLAPLEHLTFHEEGGVSGLIRGESVLFGTATLCKKSGVRLPKGTLPKNGVFLAVDRQLIAVFAVKYHAAENVDWALHALRRNRITPVLAVRDGNITKSLLRQSFGFRGKAYYPTISTRLALSEKDGYGPYALLFREGLMPFAEVTVGGKRLTHAVRTAAFLSSLGSFLALLLTFYFTCAAAYDLLTLFNMLVFLLLWSFAALVEAFFADHY